MKTALCTIRIGERDYFHMTEHAMKAYAKKVGADYIAMTECTVKVAGVEDLSNKEKACLQKLAIEPLFDRYDRILYLDADVLILPDAPDIFEAYPDSSASYLWNEGIDMDRSNFVKQVCDTHEVSPDWASDHGRPVYYNAGVMLLSKASSVLKNISADEMIWAIQHDRCFDQCFLNLLIQTEKRPVRSLSTLYNFTEVSQDTHGKHEAHFIHFAGSGFGGHGSREWQMKWGYYKAYRDTDEPSVPLWSLIGSGLKVAYAEPKYMFICAWLWVKNLIHKGG